MLQRCDASALQRCSSASKHANRNVMKLYLYTDDETIPGNMIEIAGELAKVSGIDASRALTASQRLINGRFLESCPIEFDLLPNAKTDPLEQLCQQRGIAFRIELKSLPAHLRYPNDAASYEEVASDCWNAKEYRLALLNINKSLVLAPSDIEKLCLRAIWRSAAEDPSVRDLTGGEADAMKALRLVPKNGGWEHRKCLQVLAATYAAAGDFQKAVRYQNEALKLAITKRVEADIRERLARYKSRKPLRLNDYARI